MMANVVLKQEKEFSRMINDVGKGTNHHFSC